ncbi:RdlA protein [Streptomyces glomeratus]|uniref:ATP-binding protein n=1 Tax=Streptomyces glomeratus TaxID=284452 RepID=A0ABP6M1I8_9ACTN|nr:RdlA protein [Streptomyces glomeratus]MCF1508880.1 RdlA protein [Streptomyces glomeratus]
MLKQAMAMAAVVASVVGATAAAAPQALALGDDGRTTSTGSPTVSGPIGDQATGSGTSPQSSLVQTSLNRLGTGLPAQTGTGSVLPAVPDAAQAAPLLAGGSAGTG